MRSIALVTCGLVLGASFTAPRRRVRSVRLTARPKTGDSSDTELPSPNALYDQSEVVAICMDRLCENDWPKPNSGLEICFRFSGDMCRAAVGGSLETFLAFANNPTFASMVNAEAWAADEASFIEGTQTRGAMATVSRTAVSFFVITYRVLRCRTIESQVLVRVVPRGAEVERRFLWTLQQQRRPRLQGCWLIHECLALEKAIYKTL